MGQAGEKGQQVTDCSVIFKLEDIDYCCKILGNSKLQKYYYQPLKTEMSPSLERIIQAI